MRNLAIGLAVVGLFAGLRTTAAQDSVIAEIYGYGVHAYFSGDYQEAHDYLTTAVDQGSRDPRVYYFRGLSYSRLGRPDEAKMDFEKGAQLETGGADRVYPVGRSLQRVQGKLRLSVETHRRVARLVALKRNMKMQAERYEQLQNAEGEVLRDPNRPAPTKAEDLVGPAPAADQSDPFGAGAAAAPPAVAAPPPAAGADDAGGADAFGGGTTEEAMPTEEGESDPFGTGGGDTPGTDPAPGDAENDPFSDDAPAGDPPAMDGGDDSDPFG